MSTGTTLVTVKQAIVTALRARAGLTGIQVMHGPDDFPSGDDGLKDESIWLGDAKWLAMEIPTMKAGTKDVDETYELEVMIQVLKNDGSTQETADLRAAVLLAEVQQAFAEAPDFSPVIFEATFELRDHKTGQLATTGHGSRFEGIVEVFARLSP